ncbi:D-alanine--D-alanyl carrier protein ligase [Xanthomonas arboricola pv. corylina]|nr:non-ribosomal peptide synthetase [Xanthomonas arboricola pv. corylina]CAE6702258.1 D-alanine--D-alanyl carrier protein ligase [Xanthomonas arboricola pv. corylina]CAE6702277.1 D-alanine--D-alanyl carrier protein ligase [Xanthomonas arboricola pv. corylina]
MSSPVASDTELEIQRYAPAGTDALHADPAQTDETLHAELAADLGIPAAHLDAHASLIQLGMDSMHLMAWLNRLRQRGHKVTLRELYAEPTSAGWSRLLRHKTAAAHAPTAAPSAWPQMRDGEAFELTPVQHAYLVGRSPQQTLGGVGCHLYQEFDGAGLCNQTLESAVQALIQRHPMLCVRFRSDGLQQYDAQSRWPGLAIHDLRAMDAATRDAALLDLRERLGHRVLAVERGETIDFQLSLLPDGRHRLHVNIDLLVLDAASFTLVFEELAALLRGDTLAAPDPGYDFRSYLAQLQHQTGPAREHAQRHWLDRLETLPRAPALPLACEPERIERVRIRRRRAELEPADWERFKTHAGASGVTPTMALATCFGAVLARWSNQPRLLLNLTLFDRQPLHPSVERMIADFTNVLLLDLCGEGAAFDTLAQRNQEAFADAYEHRHWSGVELLRELRKQQTHPHGAPVVFTSNLGRPLYGDDTGQMLGEPGWGISQTPQVWIDHLAFEHGPALCLQWDSNPALFPQGLVDTLFEAYIAQVRRLVDDADAWRKPLPDPMPATQRQVRVRINATAQPVPPGLLHQGFFAAAAHSPQAVALIHGTRSLSYAALAEQARRCAGALVAGGVRPGDTVAIVMSKGIGQVVAVLGVLAAGAVYVPVARDQPAQRRRKIQRDAGVAVALTCRDDAQPGAAQDTDPTDPPVLCWQEAIGHAPISAPIEVDPEHPAYVIYTSGSTGTPKGVTISHRAALNTCADINQRYRLAAGDRVLALSALHFDLSVFDIFGLLTAGGALVLVDEAQRRDPAAWCELIDSHRITVWNSVPALFDMLLTYSEGLELQAPARLRLALLSGDWIGLDLPQRYRAFRPDGQFVAMGGATEAAIWSNACDVEQVPPQWRSIPYGTPLANQRYRVVDDHGRDCPDWVPGELWIGGEGVALGYFNDPERTARQFVASADGRWYRTGDMGCYWPDGTLEFLGRRDTQVKIGGHRIELGEIETALHRIDGVRQAVAMAVGEREKSLAAFVVTQGDALHSLRDADPALPADYAALFAPIAAEATREPEVERLVADFVLEHLRRQGVDFTAPTDLDAIVHPQRIAPRWRGLLQRWLELLIRQQRLGHAAQGRGYVRGPHHHQAPWQPAGSDPLSATAEALLAHHDALALILRDQRPAFTLLEHAVWAPERLLLQSRGTPAAIDALADALKALSQTLGRPVRAVEIGARTGLAAELLMLRLGVDQLSYTALEASQDMVLRATERLAAYPHACVRRWDRAAQMELAHRADLVWSCNALHRLGDDALDALATLAAPSALIHVLELRNASCLALVSADLLAQDGEALGNRLRDAAGWQAAFRQRGLHDALVDAAGDQQRFVLRAPAQLRQPDPRKLSAALAAQLPAYMVPQRLVFLDALPLTANGKVDHQTLRALCQPAQPAEAAPEPPCGDAEIAVAAVWRTLLQAPALHRHSHFFQLGGDSLLATRLIGALDQAGFDARLGDLFDYPTLATFAATVQTRGERGAAQLRADRNARHTPFALTEVQQAYLVGRQPGFPLGGVGAHFFVEFEVADLDVPRFEAAWNRLIARHDMLRAVVREGRQQVLADVPAFTLQRHRVAHFEHAEASALYAQLSRQVLDPTRWPVFDVQAAEDDSGNSRVFVCLDNLLLDGLSMQILLAELEQVYADPDCALPHLEIGFRDYLSHLAGQPPSDASLAYWQRRLDRLPAAPQLPLCRDPVAIGVPYFVRLSDRLTVGQWTALKACAKQAGLTPSALLLSAYAAVLSAWSADRELCVNLTLFDRRPLHPQIDSVLGDFTSLLLVAWQPVTDWRASAQRLQQRLRQDLVHRDVSAIRVMRELAQRRGQSAAAMPVVFTSAIGFAGDRFLAQAAALKPRRGISQTPQVWLDHQVYESEGELRFNWDAVEALFEPAQLAAMFDQYAALLRRLAGDPDAWDLALDVLVPRAQGHATAHVATTPPALATTAPATAQPPAADAALVDTLRAQFQSATELPIAARQSFFEAGASSLQLVQWHIQLRQAGHDRLAVTDLFAHATPYALALHLDGLASAAPATAPLPEPGRQTLLEQRKARAQRRRGDA